MTNEITEPTLHLCWNEISIQAAADALRAAGLRLMAEDIERQVKPAVEEPTAFGSIVRANCAPGLRGVFWQKAPIQRKHYWESTGGAVALWSELTNVEVLRVGIGNGDQGDGYHTGRSDFAEAMRRDLSALRADAIGAERKHAYDTALATVAVLLGES
jgi:hypothetical protein